MPAGRLESIWIASAARERPRAVERATALAGRGLAGDRYAEGTGTFSELRSAGACDLTLLSSEAIEHVQGLLEAPLEAGDLRRNLVVRGLHLEPLIGATLRIGEVLVECTGTCSPCGHLERLTGIEVRELLRNRGGIRAAILEGGALEVGQAVTIERSPRVLP